MKKTETDWLRLFARDFLNLAKRAVENRRIEAVARLAIELGRAESGRPKKGSRPKVVPDVDSAARLLTDAHTALHRESERPQREVDERYQSLVMAYEEKTNPRLRWHDARRGVEPGSGGELNCNALCDPAAGAVRRKIYVGKFEIEELPDGSERPKWRRLGKWEVVRDANRFRGFVRDALIFILSKKSQSNPTGKAKTVTDTYISKVIENGVISGSFFEALVKVHKNASRRMDKGSEGGNATPPRGKRAR